MAIPFIADYPMPQPETFPANRTSWQPEPARSALLIHDMQRYFLRFYDAKGALLPRLVDNLARVARWARANDVPVIYTAQPHEQPASDRALLNDMWGPGITVAEPDQQKVVDGLEPQDGDIVLEKWRYSAFVRSDLKARMQAAGRDQLIIGGVYAHIGCMTTATDAFMNDIQPFLLGDGVADFSEAEHLMALRYVATRSGCVIATESLAPLSLAPEMGLSRDWLMAKMQALVEDGSPLDPDENLIFYGLDSLQVMRLAGELKELGVPVGFDELVRVPSLNGIWALIEGRRLAA
ncbi:isochorismatase [Azorhizobium oxalatiphilum]|uniref:isochorismatase n=1 Tax=Azorhizobium oxalatiphilum TaxID=980631 RepID=A0A917F5J0_9HYPH|nr:isochorismatase family protein [Azorhizobium oxalatiphilum]GGF50198.1 isochorismatase [Azorhizobium oxalatiphilum]